MDADGLPLVGSGINLAQVDPINSKRMLAFLNHFIIHTVGFLNHFSGACEEKLESLTIRMKRLETAVTILETKLLSIPNLDDITASSLGVQQTAAVSSTPIVASVVEKVQTPGISVAAPEADTSTSKAVEADLAEAESSSSANKASNDPRYAKYFKLLGMKIPKEALQQRMVIEGLDPSVLDNPDAILQPELSAPPNAAPPQNAPRGGNDHDFSDDDEDRLSASSSSDASSSDFS